MFSFKSEGTSLNDCHRNPSKSLAKKRAPGDDDDKRGGRSRGSVNRRLHDVDDDPDDEGDAFVPPLSKAKRQSRDSGSRHRKQKTS
jgi:hypothetical protein